MNLKDVKETVWQKPSDANTQGRIDIDLKI